VGPKNFLCTIIMTIGDFLTPKASKSSSPKVWLPALLLGVALGHAPSAQALVIFDNTINLTTAKSGKS
jgi:hypothetical protein